MRSRIARFMGVCAVALAITLGAVAHSADTAGQQSEDRRTVASDRGPKITQP